MRLLIPLFSPTMGTWGGLTRVLAITEAARAAGHEVAFCASGYLETVLRQRGYTVYSVPATTMFGLPHSLSRLIERRSQQIAPPVKAGRSIGNFWFVLWLAGFARGQYLKRLVAAELKAVADFKPDALFTDLDPGAFLLRQITGLPMGCNYQDI
ncbi:MAG TPA: hypothetical protein VHO69_17305, partial [Phototrophicaceae bacterium]|nr:hypothetical protein [Phototrophicaceae bacterium]